MQIRRLALLGTMAVAGMTTSCISNQEAYKIAKYKQYDLMEKEQNIIKQYGTSTLIPNGRLSCIEGNDIVVFQTKGDSINYAASNKLANGYLNYAIANSQKSMNDVRNDYLRNKQGTTYYYQTAINNTTSIGQKARLEDKYNEEMGIIEENYNMLSAYERSVFKPDIKQAKRKSKHIITEARKKPGVTVIKNAVK